MKPNQRAVGTAYEKIAGRYLEQQGYVILEYNFRCHSGEIDIIARDGNCVVFCEVKYRADEKAGHPLEAVNEKKQKRLSKCGLYYVTMHGHENIPCRFDVIGILKEEITHIKNAFDYVI
ncbi:MAG: YraN family protein [Lachnospiraceae bacterium]